MGGAGTWFCNGFVGGFENVVVGGLQKCPGEKNLVNGGLQNRFFENMVTLVVRFSFAT